MRPFVLTSCCVILTTATAFLTADLLFGITTPLGHPGLLLTTSSLALLAWQSRKREEKRLQLAVDRYVHNQSMREMEYERRRELERASQSDSRPSRTIAS